MELWAHQKKAVEIARGRDFYGFLFDPGCLAHDTVIRLNRNGLARNKTIEELYRLFNCVELNEREKGYKKGATYVRSLKGNIVGLHKIKAVIRSGEKELFKVKLSCHHHYLKATKDHEILTKRGWVQVQNLTKEDFVACDFQTRHQRKARRIYYRKPLYRYWVVGPYYPYGYTTKNNSGVMRRKESVHRLVYTAYENGISVEELLKKTHKKGARYKTINPKEFHIHHKDHNTLNNELSNLEKLGAKAHLEKHALDGVAFRNFGHGSISWRKVRSISSAGVGMTYDIVCEDPHRNFVANNIIVHNCGKTRTTIETLRDKFTAESRLLRTIILCPQVVCENWRREILQFSKIDPKSVVVLRGTGKKREADFLENAYKAYVSQGRIFITNYETLLMPKVQQAFKDWKLEVLVCDESHRLKNPGSIRTKRAIELADLAKYRYILTGTPVLNSLMDIYSQFRVLDRGANFGNNFFVFRNMYFYNANANKPAHVTWPEWKIRPNMDSVISDIMGKHTMHVKKSECLDLPPLIRKKVFVELSKEQQKHYDSMKKHFVTFIKDKACSAQLAITKGLRLQQIVSGFIKLDPIAGEEGLELKLNENPRAEALADLLEDLAPAHKVIVWACFRENYSQIKEVCERLKIKYVELHGEVPQSRRQEAIDAFSKDPEVRVLIGNQGAGGVGLNLVAASYAIYYSRNFSLEQDIQSEARHYRGGSEIHNSVYRVDLVAQKTIDEEVLEALSQKTAMSEKVLREIAEKL